jgi:hypothetical protein
MRSPGQILLRQRSCASLASTFLSGNVPFRLPLLALLCAVLASGCDQHILTDYGSLAKVGMSSASIEQLKQLNTADAETFHLATLKKAGMSDQTCVDLIATAHQRHNTFGTADADAVTGMSGAGFSESEILQLAHAGKLETLSGDAVTLKLIGLSDTTVKSLLQRHLDGQTTLSSGEIARLKNTGLTEAQILERINQGMSDEQAEHEVKSREAARDHYGTGFVRIHGSKR